MIRLAHLQSGKVLLMDGAMGTEVRRRCETPLDCCEHANLTDAPLVCGIHRDYMDAGADVLLTNTFQANRPALAPHGLGDARHAIWLAALELARAPRPRFVLADIGPIDNLTDEIAAELLGEAECADGVLLETWTSHDDLARIAQARREAMPPMLVSFTFMRDGKNRLVTFANQTPEECARAARSHGVVALGANCGKDIGMADMIEIVSRFHDACDLPIFVRPNAGTPVNGAYPHSPEQMAEELPDLLDAGVAMIGGCCGMTPDHVWRFRMALDAWNEKSPERIGPGL